MKIFFYKSILIFVLFILAIHFSFGLIKKELSREISNLTSKESLEAMKDKLREEIKIGMVKKLLQIVVRQKAWVQTLNILDIVLHIQQ